ncbi:uncharacterized protein LOC108671144 isoform X3 [Hyalella azteca]|uniref:Uncharacterized protein LOC108671144 isoform X3 n=1 Tax=Hyalella azteca TaxID=294128 RepID=A0A979FXF3_HYAAZ|nr:uncharacterized protein LOC108671144 isoform X3 [Hyalella azteca]
MQLKTLSIALLLLMFCHLCLARDAPEIIAINEALNATAENEHNVSYPHPLNRPKDATAEKEHKVRYPHPHNKTSSSRDNISAGAPTAGLERMFGRVPPALPRQEFGPNRERRGSGGGFYCVEKVFLWTNAYKSGQEYELIDSPASLRRTHMLEAAKTYVVIHGFMSDASQPWIIQTKTKLLQRENCNVLAVQWWAGNTYADYYRATGYVPCTGSEVAEMLREARATKHVELRDVHLIGHSLGAHVAGFVGKNVTGGVGRITGLDPAGLTYHRVDKTKRLDKTDASYVDVIHTNACVTNNPWFACYGLNEAIGHTDFWPNGGEYQPACRGLAAPHSPAMEGGLVGCDHQMSCTYFIESLAYSDATTRFLARPARSYSEYTEGNASCGHAPQYMGVHADPWSHGDHYLTTSALSPYAYKDAACPSRQGRRLHDASFTSAIVAIVVTVLTIVVPAIVIGMSRAAHRLFPDCHFFNSLFVSSAQEQEPLWPEPSHHEDGQPSNGDGLPSHGNGQPSHGEGQPSYGDGQPSHGEGQPSYGDGQPSNVYGQPSPSCGGGQTLQGDRAEQASADIDDVRKADDGSQYGDAIESDDGEVQYQDAHLI